MAFAFVTTTVLFVTVGYPFMVDATAFLSKDGFIAQGVAVGDLLEELGHVLGEEHRTLVEKRVHRLEEAMRPTFLSLPRTEEGRLHSAGVRFLLHRVFVSRHGWFVRGLAPEGEAWNTTSPSMLFVEHAGDGASVMFEDRLASKGMTLHEVAVMAASLESLVHAEAVERLHAAYRVNNMSVSAKEHDTELIMDSYMSMYISNINYTTATSEEVSITRASLQHSYPGWKETQKWMHEIRKEVLRENPDSRHSFDVTVRVLEEVAERYGRFQDQECIEIKSLLMNIERDGTGRVPLQDFYQAYLDGAFQFAESKETLQDIGALDESDPLRPTVIIPNYIYSPSNCVAGSKYYAVCCISECEDLMGHLERRIAAPYATPEQILEIVYQLPSATVEAPRTLPTSLTTRLHSVARQHGGIVPLHGRLFSQWMHHVYPRECPYPHPSGTSTSLGEKGTRRADVLEMREHIAQCSAAGVSQELALPWSDESELYVHIAGHPSESRPGVRELSRILMFLAMIGSMGFSLTKRSWAVPRTDKKKNEKWMV